MAKYRRGRIDDAVAKELSLALSEVRDPRITNNFVSFTRAEVAPDLKYARVYFSAMGDEKEAAAGLKNATGLFRRHLAHTLNLRITPELTFTADHSMEHGAKIARILHDIAEETKAREAASAEEAAPIEGGSDDE